jgi:predicted acyltransferase
MNNRYLSLDIFRGATVALMILVNNPGSFSHIFWPLDHAEWNGCTLTDLVFPFFLFAVGNAAAFVIPRFKEKGDAAFLQKVMTRSILIFLIGLFLNWSPFLKWENDEIVFKTWETVRILGVLQRISICYLLASILIYYLSENKLIFTSISLLLFYWILCYFYGDAVEPYSLNGYFGTKVDIMLLRENHMYKGEGIAFEPEGLMSSISSTVEVLLGYLAGSFIQKKGKTFEMLA